MTRLAPCLSFTLSKQVLQPTTSILSIPLHYPATQPSPQWPLHLSEPSTSAASSGLPSSSRRGTMSPTAKPRSKS